MYRHVIIGHTHLISCAHVVFTSLHPELSLSLSLLSLSLCPPHPLLVPAHLDTSAWLLLLITGTLLLLGGGGRGHTSHQRGRVNPRAGAARLHIAMMQYLDMETLSWLCVAWGMLELGFLAVIMLYLVPRMNRLEAPAKVRRRAAG